MLYQIEDKMLSRTILKTRRRILDTSFRLFARDGISVTTMVDIAQAVGLTRRTLYNHYDTKEEIALLLHHHLLNVVLESCSHSLKPEDMNREGIRRCLESLYTSLTEDRDRLAFIVYFDQYFRERNDLLEEDNRFVNYLINHTGIINAFATMQERGQFRDPSIKPELMTKVCFESLIAYMERICFREEAYREHGFVRSHDFMLLVDRLLAAIEGDSQ